MPTRWRAGRPGKTGAVEAKALGRELEERIDAATRARLTDRRVAAPKIMAIMAHQKSRAILKSNHEDEHAILLTYEPDRH